MTVETRTLVDPRDHVVLFYETTEQLVALVTQFAVDGVSTDETVVLVATAGHIVAFEEAMVAAGVDFHAARANRTLLTLDAGQSMSRFLVGDWPDPELFESEFGTLIRTLVDSGRQVRVYGEMVALLWDAGHVAAAMELEALWNELGQLVPFSLFCAYPVASVIDNDGSFQRLCHCHSAIVGQRDAATGATRSFPGQSSSLRGARHFVADTLRSWGLGHLTDDASVVVSELATNAILHARSDFTVAVSAVDGFVRVSVRDASPQLPEARDPTPTTISGRGLVLVTALGTRWGTETLSGGKEVWVEIRG